VVVKPTARADSRPAGVASDPVAQGGRWADPEFTEA